MLNEGEQAAIKQQAKVLVEATEAKLRRLGLPYIKVGLFDERTLLPIADYDYLVRMAEGKCVCGDAIGHRFKSICPLSVSQSQEAAANTARRAEETGLE